MSNVYVMIIDNHLDVSLAISVIDMNQGILGGVEQPIMRYVACSSCNLF